MTQPFDFCRLVVCGLKIILTPQDYKFNGTKIRDGVVWTRYTRVESFVK